MTVRELIEVLEGLGELEQGLPVTCTYDCDCASTSIVGVRGVRVRWDGKMELELQGGG